MAVDKELEAVIANAEDLGDEQAGCMVGEKLTAAAGPVLAAAAVAEESAVRGEGGAGRARRASEHGRPTTMPDSPLLETAGIQRSRGLQRAPSVLRLQRTLKAPSMA